MPSALDLTVFLPSLAGGGAERVMLELLRDFSQRGVRCELVLAAPGGELSGDVPAAVPALHLGRGKAWHAARALRRHLAERRPRAFLTTILSANIAGLLAVWGLRDRPRCVIRESSSPLHETAGASLRALASRAAVRLLYRHADALIALSAELGAELRLLGVPERKISIIPNAVPQLVTTPTAAAPFEGPYVLACGRLEPQKDHATLIRAFARISNRSLRLVILGEGSQRASLLQLARELGVAERVHLPGFVARPLAWYAHAALFVHTARWEGFPNAVSEALACRLPVVATDSQSGVRLLLDGGRFGALVPVGDAAAVAQAMDAVLSGEKRFPDPAAYLARFDRASVVQRYLDVLLPAGA
ncbi:MAG: glycosyltransferase [Clostridia bacterium]